jgi:hypothetical protein
MSCRYYDFIMNFAKSSINLDKEVKYVFEASLNNELFKNQQYQLKIESALGMHTIKNDTVVQNNLVGKTARNEIDFH